MAGGEVGVSIVFIIVMLPIIASFIPWWQFAGETTLGIDLGTTYSVASICTDRVSRSVVIDHNTPLVPSIVSYTGSGNVGVDAIPEQMHYPLKVVSHAKRLIGREYNDANTQKEANEVPYRVVSNNGQAAIEIPDKGVVMPEDVSAEVLRKLKKKAEKDVGYWKSLFGFQFYTATISVPVMFDGPQRAATHRAAAKAGFSMVRLIEEPVAAAIAYNLNSNTSSTMDVLVYDMGGGTLDVALLRLQKKTRTFLLITTAGDARLGGSDFDRALGTFVAANFSSSMTDLQSDVRTQFLNTIEEAKRNLSSSEWTEFDTPWGRSKLLQSDIKIACATLLGAAMEPVDDVLEMSFVPNDRLQIVLAGGSSRLVAVRDLLKQKFPGTKLHDTLDADLAISLGAAKAYDC
eukprot:TRINITY_DN924_c1_g2_i2.p1 TRINITY_DN924_c1_g2~~TRINITY_DN924_c1_g2_i2.p1  ORF type:complete len:422 (+),score=86.97 TRINITY_DN924_c1_g2_i2:59-1267(+)